LKAKGNKTKDLNQLKVVKNKVTENMKNKLL
jgi:hypothetical protein